MLRREFRIGDVAIRTVHLVGESLDLIFRFGFFGSFLRDVDSELFELREYLDDIFFQSSQLLIFHRDAIIDSVGVERKIFCRHIRRLEVEILYRIQNIFFLLFDSFLIFHAGVGDEQVTRESFSLLHFIPVLFYEIHKVFLLFETA